MLPAGGSPLISGSTALDDTVLRVGINIRNRNIFNMRAQYLHGVKFHFVNKLCNSGIKDGKNIFYMQSFKLGDDHVAAIQRKCLFIIISKDKLAADKTI